MKPVLIDASERFAALRPVEDIDLTLGAEQQHEVANKALGEYFNEVLENHPDISPYIEGYLENFKIVITQDDQVDAACDQSPLLDVSGVHLDSDNMHVLHIDQNLINEITKQFRPYFEETRLDHDGTLTASIAFSARLVAAAWIFDLVDPRALKSDQITQGSMIDACVEAGLLSLSQGSLEENTLDVFRFRYMGISAIAPFLDDPRFSMFQKVYETYFDDQDMARASDDKTFCTRFCIAHPFTLAESSAVINTLLKINDVIKRHS